MPEDKVVEEIRSLVKRYGEQILEMRVAKEERDLFELQKAEYRILIEDYKLHKKMLEEKYGKA